VGRDGWTTYGELIERDWETLNDAQRALVAVGELRTEVNNGGFDQYFFNSSGDHAPVARDAANAARAASLAELIDRALAVLGPNYTTNRDDRQTALLDLDDDAAFDALDDEYYEVEAAKDLDALMDSLAESA
jgi:Domain of unknown function (DUF4375)